MPARVYLACLSVIARVCSARLDLVYSLPMLLSLCVSFLQASLTSFIHLFTMQVLEWVRNMVANRLSSTGEQWTAVFSKYNSGTYNNQVGAVCSCSWKLKGQLALRSVWCG